MPEPSLLPDSHRDDEVLQMKRSAEHCATNGYPGLPASGPGEAALAALRVAKFDLLLSDSD